MVTDSQQEGVVVDERHPAADLHPAERIVRMHAVGSRQRQARGRFEDRLPLARRIAREESVALGIERRHSHREALILAVPVVMGNEDAHALGARLDQHVGDAELPRLHALDVVGRLFIRVRLVPVGV